MWADKRALEALIRCGVDRVLSSGQRATALEGLETLQRLGAQAGDRIIVMGCGALTPENIAHVRRTAQLTPHRQSLDTRRMMAVVVLDASTQRSFILA